MITLEYVTKQSFRQVIDRSTTFDDIFTKVDNILRILKLKGKSKQHPRCVACETYCFTCLYENDNRTTGYYYHYHKKCHCVSPEDNYYTNVFERDITSENLDYYFDIGFKYDYCWDT